MKATLRCATLWVILFMGLAQSLWAQVPGHERFRPLEMECPTPSETRLASGAPGPAYWQQQVDYDMALTLDDEKQRISGTAVVTYTNNSPHTLTHLWFALDQNLFHPSSQHHQCEQAGGLDNLDPNRLVQRWGKPFAGGFNLQQVADGKGQALKYSLFDSEMRVDLPQALAPGKQVKLRLQWDYNINDATIKGRSGYEFFPEDSNYVYVIAQCFPRLNAYTDIRGWQNKVYLGRAEFALEFGNYNVSLTVPADHVVWATGELQNAKDVLADSLLNRLNRARQSDDLIVLISGEQARRNQRTRAKATKTWRFRAERVRDFAFASSRKFAWDASSILVGGKRVLTQSLYPPEAAALWGKYATHATRHAVEVYSRHSVDYPWPHATSVHGPVWGMEYPMMAFCGGRPEPDGTYSPQVKYATISVIIHEVGHNFFPMIVNSDERRWAWMDEGLNSFLQFLAEQEWEYGYPSRRGRPDAAAPYMARTDDQPIMIHPEAVVAMGDNQYGKVASALNILRETILGRERFDHAFRTYSQRWAFRHPEPCDFFRTLEDASGVNLDWFFRAWFYGTDHVDLAVAEVREVELEPLQPEEREQDRVATLQAPYAYATHERNGRQMKRYTDSRPELLKDYKAWPEENLSASERRRQQEFYTSLPEQIRKWDVKNPYVYQIVIENKGGVPMPVILNLTMADGSILRRELTAEIWQLNPSRFVHEVVLPKGLLAVEIDPQRETADADRSNNHWPPRMVKARAKLAR